MLTPVFYDYESFWSAEHSLSKMSGIEYVMHPDTEIISCSIQVGFGTTPKTYFGQDIQTALDVIDWSSAWAIAHNNSEFDAMILAWRYGIKPKMWGCTLAMARPIHAKTAGGSLKALAKHYGLQDKGDLEATNTKGKRLADFTAAEREAMAQYNDIDTAICADLFKILVKQTSKDELKLIDMTIRMLAEPQFDANIDLLTRGLRAERARKKKVLIGLLQILDPTAAALDGDDALAEVQKRLKSAPKFKKLLESLGVEVPLKVSPNTGRKIPALAKNDQQFLDLRDHPDETVQAAVEARLDTQSSILETRMDRFINVAKMCDGKMPIALRYYGADTTGRWSGTMSLNQQNLPRVGGKPKISDVLRKSFVAPKGKSVVVADLSGIELRVNMFLWKVRYAMDEFAADPGGADLYKLFAADSLYHVPTHEVTKEQRQVGKVCLAEGTLVLTDRGEVPIEQVTCCDRVWDGVEWVTTLGAICNGVRDVITYDGITATPDHEVWTVEGWKVPIGVAASQSLRLARTGVGRVPLGFSETGEPRVRTEEIAQVRKGEVRLVRGGETDLVRQPSGRENERVSVLQPEVWRTQVVTAAHDRCEAPMYKPERLSVGAVRRSGDSVPVFLSRGCSGVDHAELGTASAYGDRPHRQQRALRTGQLEVRSATVEHQQPDQAEGKLEPILQVSQDVSRSALRGQHTEEVHTEWVDGRGDTYSLEHSVLQTQRRVWDLLNCGPRRRFTANGRLVSNCHLGLGFGAGHVTFRTVAKTMAGVDLDESESKRLVNAYRNKHHQVAQGWRTCHNALDMIAQGVVQPIDPWGLCRTCPEGIRTPKGMIRYPKLRIESNDGETEWVYGEGRKKARIYAGKVDENIVQHLARCVLADIALAVDKQIGKHYPLAHTVHDELVYVVNDSDAEEVLDLVQSEMRKPPEWWPDLVTWSEGDIAHTYGDAK